MVGEDIAALFRSEFVFHCGLSLCLGHGEEEKEEEVVLSFYSPRIEFIITWRTDQRTTTMSVIRLVCIHSMERTALVAGIEADKLNGNDFTLSISLRPYKAASCRWRAQYPVYNTRRHQTTTIEIIKREHCLIYHRDFSAPKLLWLNRTTPNSIVY